jgi:NAD(P)-dependent dehydrogenase (short-subunit alcohol dehydrogenase family)
MMYPPVRSISRKAALLILLAVPLGVVQVADLGAQASRARQSQRIVLVTGSTDGLGREVAKRLASDGAHVIIHGRNRERGQAVVDEIRKEGKGSAAFFAADFASLANVRAFADTILKTYPRIDVLVNNAGIWLREGPRQASADGYEMTFAVNYLSGYLLTRLLMPRLIASAPSRVVNVSSQSQSPIDMDDPMQEKSYSGQRAYGQSKLAQAMFTIDLAKELEGKRVTVLALHPASLMDTKMVEKAGMQPRSTVEEGVNAVVQVVNDTTFPSGSFINRGMVSRANPQAYDEAARARLKEISERLTGTRRP